MPNKRPGKKSGKPNARQWALIRECGCDPDRYEVTEDREGWLYCIDVKTGRQVYFDLSRRMPCYPREITEED